MKRLMKGDVKSSNVWCKTRVDIPFIYLDKTLTNSKSVMEYRLLDLKNWLLMITQTNCLTKHEILTVYLNAVLGKKVSSLLRSRH